MKIFITLLLMVFILVGCPPFSDSQRPVFLEANKVKELIPYVKSMTIWYSTEFPTLNPWSIDVFIDSPCGKLNIKSDRFKTFDEAVKDIKQKTECFKECKVKK